MGRRSSHPTTAPRIGESANAATVRGDGSEDDRHRRPADQPERGPACIRVADDERRSAVDPRFHLADRRVRKGSRVADDRHTVAGTEDAAGGTGARGSSPMVSGPSVHPSPTRRLPPPRP